MEYTYEVLRQCHGLRFQATLLNNPQEGIVKVTDEGITLCFGKKDPGYLCTFGRRDTFSFSKSTFTILPNDFKIIPRNPKTYKDWQIGDGIIKDGIEGKIAFRFGDIVIPLYKDTGKTGVVYSCSEFFDTGFRLILTDVEKNLKSGKKREKTSEFHIKAGDPVLVRDSPKDKWVLEVFVKRLKDCPHNYPYKTTNGIRVCCWVECLLYNKTTKHLFGTTRRDLHPQ